MHVGGVCAGVGCGGVADALRFTTAITRKDSRDAHVYTGDPFEVQFSVSLENSQPVETNIKSASAADIGYAANSGTRPDVSVTASITTDDGYDTNDTHYYTVTTGPVDNTDITGVVVRLTTHTRNWGVSTETPPSGQIWRGASAADKGYAANSGTRPDVPVTASITTDDGYDTNDTHYYTVTTGPVDNTNITGVVVRLTTHTRNWVTEAEAYYYNREAVTITSMGGISIVSINGHTINGAPNTYTLNENERWGGTTTAELTNGQIRVRCSAGSAAEPGKITVTDATAEADATDADYPRGVLKATAPSSFNISIVANPLSFDSTTFPTILDVAEGVLTLNVRNQISVTLAAGTGTNNQNAEVGFEVLSGSPGTLYQNREGGSGVKKLLTYTDSGGVARVYLLPNSRTNRVRVWVSGRNPASADSKQARVVTFTYGFADLTADTTIGGPGGSGQRGVDGTRLANPFVVKVIDGTNRGFPGAAVTFDITAPETGAVLFPHPDFRAEPATTSSTKGGIVAGYDPLVITTDRNGEAKVYLQLRSRNGEIGGILHTVTASYQGSTRTFTATGIEATSATYVLTVDTQRSAQTQSVALRTRASRPLVVRVLEGGVNPVTNQGVRFTTTDGTLSPRREAMQQPDREGIPNRPHDRTILTNVRGEAWIDYIAGKRRRSRNNLCACF